MERTTVASDSAAVLAALSDRDLAEHVKTLAACERRASVALIRSLVEFDFRRLYLREGCSSLFTYCTEVLHLAEGSAYNRIVTARAVRRYPVLLDALERGDLTLTAARLLAPHLTSANYIEVLEAARHRSKQGILELIASLSPRAAAATVIRRLAPPPSRADVAATPSDRSHPVSPGEQRHDASKVMDPSTFDGAKVMAPAPQNVVTPLAPDCYRLQVTLTRATHEKLRRAQALARHAVPNGDVGTILDRALTLLIAEIERSKCGRTTAPRRDREDGFAKGRYIPAAVRRRVWDRDGGRCAFVGATGRCRETSFLEFHHVDPYAAGGAATVENIQLRCRAHNEYERRVFFGPQYEYFRGRSRPAPSRDPGGDPPPLARAP